MGNVFRPPDRIFCKLRRSVDACGIKQEILNKACLVLKFVYIK